MDVLTRAEPYDACVIGSGPAGATAARELVLAGARVLLLEAGREVQPSEYAGHKWPYQFPHRGSWPERQAIFYPDDIDREVRFSGDPLSASIASACSADAACTGTASRSASRPTTSARARCTASSRTGRSPTTSSAPFYSEAERLIGVVGTREGLPQLPDGDFYAPPPPMRCAEQLGRKACRTLGIPMIPVRKALQVGTMRGTRMPCHYCRHCMDGCEVGAIATSVNAILPDALATGRLTLRTNALVRRIDVDGEGRASGVTFVDRVTRRDHSIRARFVVVGCGAIETPRLLLNSSSARFPNGLANSSGLVGRYLTGHTQLNMHGYLEALVGRDPVNQDGATDHSIIPRYNHLRPAKDHIGGFFAQVMYETHDYPHHATRVAGFGTSFKREVARAAARDVPDGRHGQGDRAAREPCGHRARDDRRARHSAAGRCSSPTATTTARCGTRCRPRSKRSFTRRARACSSRTPG